mmetsp:Transcript_34061/g.75071  ORF Transcript_34061/g.75071 Transcript_34061/m.75071 type:complete len:315 (+) Transcript_34061:570-1514(+)
MGPGAGAHPHADVRGSLLRVQLRAGLPQSPGRPHPLLLPHVLPEGGLGVLCAVGVLVPLGGEHALLVVPVRGAQVRVLPHGDAGQGTQDGAHHAHGQVPQQLLLRNVRVRMRSHGGLWPVPLPELLGAHRPTAERVRGPGEHHRRHVRSGAAGALPLLRLLHWPVAVAHVPAEQEHVSTADDAHYERLLGHVFVRDVGAPGGAVPLDGLRLRAPQHGPAPAGLLRLLHGGAVVHILHCEELRSRGVRDHHVGAHPAVHYPLLRGLQAPHQRARHSGHRGRLRRKRVPDQHEDAGQAALTVEGHGPLWVGIQGVA